MPTYSKIDRLRTDAASYLRRDRLRLFTIVNALAVILLWAAESHSTDQHWLMLLITYAPQHLLLVPATTLAVWARRCGRRRILALNAGIAVLMLVVFLGFNVPFERLLLPRGRTIRLMSYNIHHADAHLPQVLSAIRQVRPDILCLEEGDSIGGGADPATRVASALPGWHLFRRGEVAVLSRFPIVSTDSYRPPHGSASSTLHVVVDLGGRRLTVVAGHLLNMLAPDAARGGVGSIAARMEGISRVREGQYRRMIGTADLSDPPVVIAGDLNTPPRGSIYRRLASRYRDSFCSAGWGFGCTYPSACPLLRIDYVFTGPGVQAKAAFAPPTRASDHRPLVADLVIQDASP